MSLDRETHRETSAKELAYMITIFSIIQLICSLQFELEKGIVQSKSDTIIVTNVSRQGTRPRMSAWLS